MQELKILSTAENGGAITSKPETFFEGEVKTIGVTLSDRVSSDDKHEGEDKADDEEDIYLRKPSDDDEPGRVMSTISKTLQHCMESFRKKQMMLHELAPPGWMDAANYCCK
jgi:hypothetical protein